MRAFKIALCFSGILLLFIIIEEIVFPVKIFQSILVSNGILLLGYLITAILTIVLLEALKISIKIIPLLIGCFVFALISFIIGISLIKIVTETVPAYSDFKVDYLSSFIVSLKTDVFRGAMLMLIYSHFKEPVFSGEKNAVDSDL